jgi:hypothetical protein
MKLREKYGNDNYRGTVGRASHWKWDRRYLNGYIGKLATDGGLVCSCAAKANWIGRFGHAWCWGTYERGS